MLAELRAVLQAVLDLGVELVFASLVVLVAVMVLEFTGLLGLAGRLLRRR